MAAAARLGPYRPLALAAAKPTDEFDLTYRTHFFRSAGAVHGAGLNKHSGTHVVTAMDVRGQFVEQIPLVGHPLHAQVPEMVMGIADGQLRFQRRFQG